MISHISIPEKLRPLLPVLVLLAIGAFSVVADSVDAGATLSVEDEQTSYLPLALRDGPENAYYLSPAGDDSNDGRSPGQAWATFGRAWDDLYPGDTLLLMDGVYYQSITPDERNGEPGNPITIRALNDGQAIIDGENERIPVFLEGWPGPIGEYFVVEGIIARNSNDSVFVVPWDHNVLRRVSGYNANTDGNYHVFNISGYDNVLEDCVAAGTGRKMILLYNGGNNTVRRCFTDWQEWKGRDFGVEWPWGENINIYNSSNNIVENSIGIGPVPYRSLSIIANCGHCVSTDNRYLGSIALWTGMNQDDTLKYWGCDEKPEPCGSEDRPQPTEHDKIRDFGWHCQRSGFQILSNGDTFGSVFRDIFSWNSAALGFAVCGSTIEEGVIDHASIFFNGHDNPESEGGAGLNVQLDELSSFTITNSYIGGTTHQGAGARLTHRYVDGVLTDEPLWPWPMEGRIQDELGISVTDLVTDIIFAEPESDASTRRE